MSRHCVRVKHLVIGVYPRVIVNLPAPADKVPDEIYQIPPSSAKHNVTYVNIYESTPDTVTYGYTAGYSGVYVGYGVAMWGTS